MPCGNISLYFNVLKVYGWALVSTKDDGKNAVYYRGGKVAENVFSDVVR